MEVNGGMGATRMDLREMTLGEAALKKKVTVYFPCWRGIQTSAGKAKATLYPIGELPVD